MISFNDLKNNIEIMKNCLKDMKFFDQKDKNIKANFIQEEVLRKNFPQLFLQILHYVLIEFSYDFFTEVLQQCPTIRTDNDMPFIQHTILISRSLLKIDVKIDANQFFNQNKFFQKKVELISRICKSVYEFQMSRTKIHVTNGNISNINKSKNINKNQLNKNPKMIKNYIEQDEEDQDMPRNINVAPTKIQPSVTSFNSHLNSNKFQNQNNSDSDQQLRLLRERKNKIQNIAQKPKQIVKKPSQKQKQQQLNMIDKKTVTRLNRNMELTKQQPQRYNNKQQTQKVYFNAENIQNKNINIKEQEKSQEQQQQQQQQQQSEEYMTRKQVLQIMSLLNTNISKLITNFNDFQKDVGTWMNNINAKVSLLQENVKTIRNNL